jgi:hypothetical protein
MKGSLYWIKVDLLIGLGFLLVQIFAPTTIVLIPFAAIAAIAVLILLLVILLFGTAGRLLDSLLGYFKLRQGWVDRANRSAKH